MEGAAQELGHVSFRKVLYRSPKHAQVWFLRRSRDGWKAKYGILQANKKKVDDRVRDLTKCRDQWAAKAAQEVARAKELEQENADLKQQLEGLKKSGLRSSGGRTGG